MRVHFQVEFELSPRTKRWLKLGIPVAVLLAGGVALAGVANTLKDGDPLSAQTMNANFASLDTRLAAVESLVGGDGGAPGVATWRDSTNALVPIVETRPLGVPGGDYPVYNFYDSASKAIWQYSNANTNWQWSVTAPHIGLMV